MAAPRRVDFHRVKYGRELLIDAPFVRAMSGFRAAVAVPHVLTFHEILLVTRGRGQVDLDGERHALAPGRLLFTAPGEVRRLDVPRLDGACLFFPEEFLAEAFRDGRFLEQFAYFRAGRASPVLTLHPQRQREFLRLFRAMQREIASLQRDASHALRALLYELLVLLGRWYVARHGDTPQAARGGLVERFRALVERDHARRHRLADYAAELGVTPGHLSALCRAELGLGGGECIRARLAAEARRLVGYGGVTIAEAAERLGFDDPAYFARFFRREVGVTPSEFRRGVVRAADVKSATR